MKRYTNEAFLLLLHFNCACAETAIFELPVCRGKRRQVELTTDEKAKKLDPAT